MDNFFAGLRLSVRRFCLVTSSPFIVTAARSVRVWKYPLSQQDFEWLFKKFCKSGRTIKQFCEHHGVRRSRFEKAGEQFSSEQFKEQIAAHLPKGSPYKRGRAFEYMIRKKFQDLGCFVWRSPSSKGAADVLVLKAGQQPLMIQAKLDGKLPPDEWDALIGASLQAGAVPILAARPAGGHQMLLWVLGPRHEGQGEKVGFSADSYALADESADLAQSSDPR